MTATQLPLLESGLLEEALQAKQHIENFMLYNSAPLGDLYAGRKVKSLQKNSIGQSVFWQASFYTTDDRGTVSDLSFQIVDEKAELVSCIGYLPEDLLNPRHECEACGKIFVECLGEYEQGEYSYCADCCHW